MAEKPAISPSKETVDHQVQRAAGAVLDGKPGRGKLSRLWPFLGPAFIASVAYVDPGNFATNIQGGALFGYRLLWVIVASNLMAMLVQTLSAKMGIASGNNLAELCRLHFPRPLTLSMWVVMEIVAMATDLAEFIGAAVGFQLLFGIPLWMGGLLTAGATILILGLQRYGFRPLEVVISLLIGIVAASYLMETILDRPNWTEVFVNAVVPRFAGPASVVVAAGILGATVMPHAIFLHSALTQGRIVVRDPARLRRLFKFEVLDVTIAMGLAGLVNGAMLVMAAATFHHAGQTEVGTLEEAHRTLEPLLGRFAGTLFAVSLLASGLSSSAVGTMAGQIIMQGFLRRQIAPWLRRLITMLPSIVVIAMGLDPTRALVISQVILSFGLPFAVIPLVWFTRKRSIMGVLVNRPATTIAAGLVAAVVVVLNGYLLWQTLLGE